MTTVDTVGTDHSGATADLSHSHGVVPAVSRAARPTSFDIATFPVPGGREEEWRFTPVARLAPVLADEPAEGHLDWTVGDLPDGVTLAELPAEDAAAQSVRAPGDRASVVAAAQSGGAMILRVAAGVEPADPIEIRLAGTGGDVRGHLLIEVGERANATVVFEYSGSATYSEFVSVDVADGASLTLAVVQGWERDAIHTSEMVARLGRGSKLRGSVVTLGGALVRQGTNVAFAGDDGQVDLYGLYFADAGQHMEHRVFVDHARPRCRSRVTYKGALAGAGARTVWIGDVLIRAAAEGTDTYELNRNLVLTDGARADSVPNLEIETGEIEGAGHASATGRFDDEQMFYLRSRGIPEAEARRLVVRGFFADVIREIGIPRVERDLMRAIERELEAVHD